jgi:hypothetical protein
MAGESPVVNDVELLQNFCFKYINKVVKKHFKDIEGGVDTALDKDSPRPLVKRLCLHKNTDPLVLTIARLLIWWIEARGLFDEYIFGMPGEEFEIKHTYYPQLKIHFSEDKLLAARANRRPARSEISIRWREENYSTGAMTSLANKILAEFTKPLYSYGKGRLSFTYWDNRNGYRFQVFSSSEAEAKGVIAKMIGLQDTETPDWDKNLRETTSKVNFNVQETVSVLGKAVKKPKKRPVATVKFAWAEFFIPGTTKPLVLVDATGTKGLALVAAQQ